MIPASSTDYHLSKNPIIFSREKLQIIIKVNYDRDRGCIETVQWLALLECVQWQYWCTAPDCTRPVVLVGWTEADTSHWSHYRQTHIIIINTIMAAKEGDDPHGDARWLQMVIILLYSMISIDVMYYSTKDSLPRLEMVNQRLSGLETQ